jgi:flagellar motor switch protein FliN
MTVRESEPAPRSEGRAGDAADPEEAVEVRPHALPELQPEPKPPAADRAPVELLIDVPVDVTIERTTVPLEEVLKFGPGHVVRLAQTTDEPVTVKVNGRPIAEGEVVDLGDTLGVRITAILEARDAALGAERPGPPRPAGKP